MRFDVVLAPAELQAARLGGRTIAVVDVLRATSTIVEALANGARAVIPVDTVERAVRTAAEIGRDNVVLCGERGSLPIEGFHMGNSPLEFGAERVGDRTLVMTTTNGTRALLAGSAGGRCLVGAFLNLAAVAEALLDEEDVVLLCAGREGRFSLEDAICAGLIGRRLAERRPLDPTDGGRSAIVLAGRFGESTDGFLGRTAAARNLIGLGMGRDVEFCGMLDRHTCVPEMRDLRITI